MVEQKEEEWQFRFIDTFFIKRQDEAISRAVFARGIHHVVGIFDALGNALGGDEFPDIVTCEQSRQRFGCDHRINRHLSSESAR